MPAKIVIVAADKAKVQANKVAAAIDVEIVKAAAAIAAINVEIVKAAAVIAVTNAEIVMAAVIARKVTQVRKTNVLNLLLCLVHPHLLQLVLNLNLWTEGLF